ncbi:SDR family NAD(P)-dependent oxidoreductase [Micromonospora sp. LOL_014]|uniref:type I polyketide synthase n=1 Tax=Micromonospora sp. LOL_014 TaxID=3345415 RepID=UPI003A87A097
MTRISIVGMACRYPDATSPRELWDNALAGRRAFRRLPDVRMRLADYWDADPAAPDRFYARNAAVIEGYEFDRIAYKIAGSTYRSTDLAHWLALDVAATALADAGFPMAEGLPRERTSVVVGNSLTGEFSRANLMRLRWPYVRRMVAAALKEQDWDDEQLGAFLANLETSYKAPFPAVDEDTLAGGLSNTIAGRICNHFDLKGGGYTVDGACSSSLLSVATACKSLLDGEVDVAIAGGVDLSIDPFEIIGFAKTGALARGEMRVYDKGSNGFWPGEGCGMIVLMREPDATAAGHRSYATIAGWGISSDGKGGITRPEVSGYQLALHRAYERAGFGIDTVGLFEGHGTGTAVGDSTELKALTLARQAADPDGRPAVIGSIKGMIGHTKAAAGVAGLIKAAMAVHHEVLPPAIGCVDPHDELTRPDAALRVLRQAEPWSADVPVRASVTAMGFGGINTHVVLEKRDARRRSRLDSRTFSLATSVQDAELLAVDALSRDELRERLHQLVAFVPTVAYAQLADLAATLHRELRDLPYRAAVVVTSPEDAVRQLQRVLEALDTDQTRLVTEDGRAFLGYASGPGRIGYLFPGQGSGRGTSGGALRRRFTEADQVYRRSALPESADGVATSVAQPRIVTGSLAGLTVLANLGVEATVAVGHSLGEISALHWAGAIDEETLLRVARVRGQTMATHSASGTMAGVGADPDTVLELLTGTDVVIAGYNGPQQTVVAGPVDQVERVCHAAREAALAATPLAVSHAFHSPLVAPAAGAFADQLTGERFQQLHRTVVSTVTGEVLPAETDVPALLHRQIVDPVLFAPAAAAAAKDVDLLVEVGPGRVLSGLAAAITDVPALALDTDSQSLVGLLRVVAGAFVVGAAGIHSGLFHGRLTRSLAVGAEFTFFASPCEAAPTVTIATPATMAAAPAAEATPVDDTESTVDLLRRMAADRAELPMEMVRDDSRLLDDLHLSSITVGQLVNQAAARRGIAASATPTNFATATVGQLADALDQLSTTATDGEAHAPAVVDGAATWSRAFRIDLDPAGPPVPVAAAGGASAGGGWRVYARDDHPLAEPLRLALDRAGLGGGVLVCLSPQCPADEVELALRAARELLAGGGGDRFVLVQSDRGAAGLAKTLRLEAPQLKVTVVHVPLIREALPWVCAEVAATDGFVESYYEPDGSRRVPVLRALPVRAERTAQVLGGDDVLLVTGGGKGITAECALALAADSGARLAVLGRSDPADDPDLAANLRRMTDAGITVHYGRADVTDTDQVQRAVAQVTDALGPVTAVLHGAGRNEPTALTNLDMVQVRQTFAPKVDGLDAVLAAVDPDQLRLLVTFGSIIGRAGLRGEAHYATANEWLAERTVRFQREHPQCRAVCMEWSVWSGVGMGERLSVVESLQREGVIPISLDDGVALMRRLVGDPDVPPVVVVSGRTTGIDTVAHDLPDLPLLRFVDKPLVRYHGVELVCETVLHPGSDLYLDDHRLDGNLLFPAVFGMEAMAQVATAVTGASTVPRIEQAEFLRPIVVPPDGSTTVRIAATVVDDATVDVTIRSAETAFAAEHFRARLRFDTDPAPDGPPDQVADGLPPVALDPARDLYVDTMFQGARFQRVRRYHRAAARHIDTEVAADPQTAWFAPYLPGDLLLGDPGLRDALMHANQVCVPDATLLPQGIDRVHPGGADLVGPGDFRFCAVERSRDGDTYHYDIAVRDGDGRVVERWEGLRLRAVRKKGGAGPWVAPLLGPYLERTVQDLLGSDTAVVVEPALPDEDEATTRRERTGRAAGRALGRPVSVTHRPDGRPELAGTAVSAAHGAGVTLCVTGTGDLGCDVEAVAARSADEWRDLLGNHLPLAQLLARELAEPLDVAATRVWSAVECLQKIGRPQPTPLSQLTGGPAGWVVLASGSQRIATVATTLRDHPGPVVVAVLAQGR